MLDWQKWLIVIPARMGSSRLPGKPLADLCGAPLVVRVYQRLQPLIDQGAFAVVATDSQKVMAACQQHQVPCRMTREDHSSGTDRVCEVARHHDYPFVLNVQGDEPFVDTATLSRLAEKLSSAKDGQMATVIYRNHNAQQFGDPNVVKAVVSKDKAIYFSRSPIPCYRDGDFAGFWQHQGIYGFSRKTLLQFCEYPPHELENWEKLEQLRAIGQGIAILTVETKKMAVGIDTPQDLEEAREIFTPS